MYCKSCHFIEHGIVFTWNDVKNCCMYHSTDGQDVLFPKYFADKEFNIDDILIKKRELRKRVRVGDIPVGCRNCFNLEEKEWDSDDYINVLYISHWTKCNCNCFYCYYDGNKKYFQKFKNKKLLPLLKKMKENNVLRFDGYIVITGGEPTELNELDDIIKFLLENDVKKIVLNSSGLEYKKWIAKAIEENKLELTVSIDSGERELYKKIKRMDKFDKVVSNLKKYISAQENRKDNVQVKYIIIPKVNDRAEDLQNWLDLCIELRVKHIILDVETSYYMQNRDRIPDYIKELIKYVEEIAAKNKIKVSYYSHASQIKHEMNKGK